MMITDELDVEHDDDLLTSNIPDDEDISLGTPLPPDSQKQCSICPRKAVRASFGGHSCTRCKNAFYKGFNNLKHFVTFSDESSTHAEQAQLFYDYFTLRKSCKIFRFSLFKAKVNVLKSCVNFCVNCRFRLWILKIAQDAKTESPLDQELI